jgi:hypothetical protein
MIDKSCENVKNLKETQKRKRFPEFYNRAMKTENFFDKVYKP